jgi:hypothetical protein
VYGQRYCYCIHVDASHIAFGLDEKVFYALISAICRLLCPILEDVSRDTVEAEAGWRAGHDRPEQLLYDARYSFIHDRVVRAK